MKIQKEFSLEVILEFGYLPYSESSYIYIEAYGNN